MTVDVGLAAAREFRLAGRPADALRALDGLTPTDEVVLERALALTDLDAADEGFALATGVLATDPDDVSVLLAFASIADRADQDDAALAAAERAVEIAPDRVPALLAFASIASRQWALEPEADRAIAAAVRIAPDDPDVITTMGDVLANSGRFDTAVAAYERALRIAPQHRHALRRRAAVLHHVGQDAAAVEGYWDLVADRPGDLVLVQRLRQALLGTLRRTRVLLGTAAIGALVAGMVAAGPVPDRSESDFGAALVVIAVIGWGTFAAATVSIAVLVHRAVRRNRTAIVRVVRAWPLLVVVVAVLGGSALCSVVAAVASALPGDGGATAVWSWPWPAPALAAFGLVLVASVLSLPLHWQAAGQPRAPRDRERPSRADRSGRPAHSTGDPAGTANPADPSDHGGPR